MSVNKIILNGQEIELSDEQARRIIGSGNLATVAQTLIGGVNELDTKVGDGILTTENKALIGSVNEINEKISVINGDITNINETITNIGSSTSGAIFKQIGSFSKVFDTNINAQELKDCTISLKGWENLYAGYTPYMLLSGYASNGIIVVGMSYTESNTTITVKLYNPYGETRNSGTVNIVPLFVKNGAF